jgi:hypothetical protein
LGRERCRHRQGGLSRSNIALPSMSNSSGHSDWVVLVVPGARHGSHSGDRGKSQFPHVGACRYVGLWRNIQEATENVAVARVASGHRSGSRSSPAPARYTRCVISMAYRRWPRHRQICQPRQALRGMCADGGKSGGRIVCPWYGGGPVAQQNRITRHAALTRSRQAHCYEACT